MDNLLKNINKTDNEYKNLVKEQKPSKNKTLNFVKAYVIGGFICVIGQGFWDIYILLNFNREDAAILSVITMIFLGGLFTGLGIYDKISQFSGAGSLVPITGFANAMVSPAMEYKQEGLILGLGAKMFNVAGPVLVYGMITSFIIGVLKMIL